MCHIMRRTRPLAPWKLEWCVRSANSRSSSYVNFPVVGFYNRTGRSLVWVGRIRIDLFFQMINLGHWDNVHWPDNWTATTTDGKKSAQFEDTLLWVISCCLFFWPEMCVRVGSRTLVSRSWLRVNERTCKTFFQINLSLLVLIVLNGTLILSSASNELQAEVYLQIRSSSLGGSRIMWTVILSFALFPKCLSYLGIHLTLTMPPKIGHSTIRANLLIRRSTSCTRHRNQLLTYLRAVAYFLTWILHFLCGCLKPLRSLRNHICL